MNATEFVAVIQHKDGGTESVMVHAKDAASAYSKLKTKYKYHLVLYVDDHKFDAMEFQPQLGCLRLKDGSLIREQGFTREYLLAFAERANISPDEPMVLITKRQLESLYFAAQMNVVA